MSDWKIDKRARVASHLLQGVTNMAGPCLSPSGLPGQVLELPYCIAHRGERKEK